MLNVKILKKVFDEKGANLFLGDTFCDHGFDSLDALEISMGLEEELDIEMSDEYLEGFGDVSMQYVMDKINKDYFGGKEADKVTPVVEFTTDHKPGDIVLAVAADSEYHEVELVAIDQCLGVFRCPVKLEASGRIEYCWQPLSDIKKVDESRIIVSAANRMPGDDRHVFVGARHWDEFMSQQADVYIKAKGIQYHEVGDAEQGFIDNKGVFLTRREAWIVANRQNQVRKTGPGFSGPELYSENLY